MNKPCLFLAWRYLKGSRKEKSISTMVIICFLGILIGSFSLALIASIMNGFEKVTHERMQSIHPQIIAHANGQELDFEKISNVLKQEFPEIKAFSPSSMKQAIVQSDTDDQYYIIGLKGIDPKTEHTVCNIEKKIIKSITPKKALADIAQDNRILIGEKLAENLDVSVGDQINIFFSTSEKITRKKIKLDRQYAIVGGIFKTGIDEFDNNLAISSLPFFKNIFDQTGITQISITLQPHADEKKVITQLRDRFGIEAYSWKNLYPALVEALKLEKYAMFLILALITLVASMNIISLLFMQIIQKRPDIAILKAMGMPNIKISRIFLYMGMTIAFAGSLIGLLLAFISGWILEHYPFIKLPDAYYVTYLPAKMEWSIFFAVFAVVMILSFLSTWFPTRKTRNINISQILRFEG
ncbi:FtsX-like permease family protein [Candidatus Dependentiae bacterium]